MASAGYSGTPLPKKLGIKPGMKWLVIDAPRDYRTWLGELPDGVRVVSRATAPFAAVHVFVTEREVLGRVLKRLRHDLDMAGLVWVSWPKKASNVPTDITEDVVRAVALPLDFVDIKVCAVTDIWSGLKLVIRKKQRVSS